MTDNLRSYCVAHRELMPEVIHSTEQYDNNRAEQLHEATRVRGRGMRRFKSTKQAQQFLGAHAPSLIYLTLVGTWSALNTIEILGSVRLKNGEGRLLEICRLIFQGPRN